MRKEKNMAKKKNKTGLMVILLIGGIIIGVIAAVLVMTMINKKTGTETKETVKSSIL